MTTTAGPDPADPRVRPGPSSPAHAWVAVFASAATLAAVGLTLAIGGDGPKAHVTGVGTPVLALILAACFAASEAVPVHLELRRETISFSLSLIPLVVGLYTLGPLALVAARLAGSAVTLVGHRRQRSIKLAVNLSGFWLETAVAAVVFRSLAPVRLTGTSSWPAAYAATATAATAFAVHLAAAISIYQRRWEASLRSFIAAIVAGAVVETSIGVVAVTLLALQPAALLPLAVTIGLVLASYRTHGSLVAKHRDLEQLYDITGVMGDALRDGNVLPVVLAQAAELLHAEAAWVLLEGDDESLLQAAIGVGGTTEVTVAGSAAAFVHRAARDTGGPTLLVADSGPLAALGASEVLAAPLTGPSGALGTLAVGDRSGQVRRFGPADLRRFGALAGQASVAIENSHLIDRLRRQAADSEHQSLHDPLTGLPNRALFSRELAAALGTGATLAVLLLDLDRFKEVNDTLGHQNGDLLLEQVGSRLRDALRTGDLVARLGGDEFAVLLPDIRAEAAAVQVARGIVELLEQPFPIGDMSIDVGASIGIAIAPSHGEDAGTLMRRADVAMYSAKTAQTCVEVYRADHDGYSPERLTLVSDLRRAVHGAELEVHFQPQLDLSTDEVIGVEALVRWNHPTRGRIQPDDFIAMAEHTGLIRPLTHVVLDEALRECRRWRDAGWPLRVSVNVSARALLQGRLADEVAALLAAHRLPASALCLEVTETSIMADPRRSVAVLDAIHATGVAIAVDDFGIGHSSLAYLKGLPVGEVKVDKSFVQMMVEQPEDRAIVQTVIDLARNLQLVVVAEGVENIDTVRDLQRMGCDIGQGYHYSRPVAADDLLVWLEDRSAAWRPPVVMPLGHYRGQPDASSAGTRPCRLTDLMTDTPGCLA